MLTDSEEKHACDFIDEEGEEISTSLMPENVQISQKIDLSVVIESHGMHACDFIDEEGEEISTSLMPENV
tara:strand:- start:458 stop:667 length:210 start_codon:yes stop_codon:yes gene_type:complete